jgi:hypothetical protein
MKLPVILALGLAVAIAGCGGKGSTSSQQATQTAAPASVASGGESAAATSPASSNANPVTTLPVYPGATKLATQFTKPMTFCSHKVTMTVYHVSDSPEKVSSWYASRMSGSTIAKIASPGAATSGQGTSYFVVDSGGGFAAVVYQMHFGSLEKQAQRLGMGKTTIGLNSYDPPLSSDEIALFKAGSGTDAAAKAQAAAQLKQKCGSNSFSVGG